jgi:uncharacterized glyoxalase superfamily protein PhnB
MTREAAGGAARMPAADVTSFVPCDDLPMGDRSFPILGVAALPVTVEFYETLGFEQTYAFPAEGPPAFVTLERDGSTLGLATRDAADSDKLSYWVYVDDVDSTFGLLTAAGAPAVAEPRTEPWGERVASVRDPDGTVVHLGASGSPP